MPITGKLAADFSDFDKAVRVSSAELAKFESSATKTTVAFSTFATSLGNVDRIAALLGVRLGPLAAALSELTVIMGALNLAMGTLTPIGLALAAAFATFKVAELVRDYTSLDEKLTDVIYSTMGWTQGTKEASTTADELRRASEYAGIKITDLSTAMKLNAQHAAEVERAWDALAKMEETLADRADEKAQSFAERFRQRADARSAAAKQENDAYAKMLSESANATGVAQMTAAKAAMDQAAASAEANERGLQLMLLDFITFTEALEAEAEKARQQIEKEAADFLRDELSGGVLVTGMTPSSLERPQSLSQSGVVAFGPAQEGMFTFPGAAGSGTTVNNINMSGMLLSDDPGTLDQLRTTINRALSPSMKQGRYYGSS